MPETDNDRRCELCLTTLEIGLPDGRRMQFSKHDAEYCKLGTLQRLRIMDGMVKQHTLAELLVRHEARDLATQLMAIKDKVENLHQIAGLAVTEAINGENPLHRLQSIHLILTVLLEPPKKRSDRSAEMPLFERLAREDRPTPEAVREVATRPDLHHSQGVEVAEVLAGIPTDPSKRG